MSRVAIIGAGVSGLPAIKCCLEEGLKPVCFEKKGYIGGVWQYHEDRKPSDPPTVWKGLRIYGSRFHHIYTDFDDEDNLSLYLTHEECIAYLHRYAERFNLKRHIRLRTEVVKVEPRIQGWNVTYKSEDGEETVEHFDLVLVASGRFAKPLHPDIEGLDSFTGFYKHSNEFMHPNTDEINGKRVLVVGNNVSAGEIAAFIAKSASEVFISTRNGTTLIQRMYPNPTNPNYVPMETVIFDRTTAYHSGDPINRFSEILATLSNEALPHQGNYNLGTQNRHWMTGGVSISALLGKAVGQGEVVVKRRIVKISGKEVQFEDGEKKEFDTIYAATGFDVHFPFLSRDIIAGTTS